MAQNREKDREKDRLKIPSRRTLLGLLAAVPFAIAVPAVVIASRDEADPEGGTEATVRCPNRACPSRGLESLSYEA